VSWTSSFREHLWVHALPVIADPQAKLFLIVSDFSFNPPRAGVSKRISEQFQGYSVNLILQNRSQCLSVAFHSKGESRRGTVTICSGFQFFTSCHQQLFQIGAGGRRGTQIGYGILAFSDGLFCPADCLIESFHCLYWAT
jgi:hypothetical protein